MDKKNDSQQRKLMELWTQKTLENLMECSDSSTSSTTAVRTKLQTKSGDSITKQK